MPSYYSYFDGYSIYLLTMIPALLISLYAQIRVKSSFAKYSARACSFTGAQAAQRILAANGLSGVRIERVSGNLTDHYDPKTNVIRLSESVFHAANIAAVGVAAHEVGHAIQYAKGYAPIRVRAAILPVCQLGSQLSMPLLLLGIVFSFPALIELGILFFCVALLFQLITLPVEFNASRRALASIREIGIFHEESAVSGVRRVLTAAAMTYVASVVVSLLQLVRLLALAGRGRRR